jgi:hypothetical protein
MGLSFTIAAVPRQRSHSQVLVPRDSWPNFTLSDLRLLQPGGPSPRICLPQGTGWPGCTPRHWVPFSSPPTIRRATVEVFDLSSTHSQRTIDSLCSIRTDHTKNASPNSSYIVATCNYRTDRVGNIASPLLYFFALRAYCLSMGVFAKPSPSNGCLCWLHSSCLQKICHSNNNMADLRTWEVRTTLAPLNTVCETGMI